MAKNTLWRKRLNIDVKTSAKQKLCEPIFENFKPQKYFTSVFGWQTTMSCRLDRVKVLRLKLENQRSYGTQ